MSRSISRLVIQFFVIIIAAGALVSTDARPKRDIRPKPELMDSPLPPGREELPQIPDSIGHSVVVLERMPDGQVHQVGLRVSIPGHDLRVSSWRGAESMRVASYLANVRTAIRKAGEYAGKSSGWIADAQGQIGGHSIGARVTRTPNPLEPDFYRKGGSCEDSLTTPLIDFYAPHERSMMINGGTTVQPACTGGGCGTIVCASTATRGGAIVGCGGSCGGCSIVTVCSKG